MNTKQEIENFMAQCYGTDKPYTIHSLCKRLVFTDSIKVIREMANCFWLVDAIASYQHKLTKQSFQVWKLVCDVELHTAILTCGDGNGNELVKQEIEYTDFPLSEITLWAELGGYMSKGDWVEAMVLMVPSER